MRFPFLDNKKSSPLSKYSTTPLLFCFWAVAIRSHNNKNSSFVTNTNHHGRASAAAAFLAPTTTPATRGQQYRKTVFLSIDPPFLRFFSAATTTTTINMSSTSSGGADNDDKLPRIEGSEVVGSTKWLRLETLTYTDIERKERKWDYATRTTKKDKNAADAVVIIPLLKRPYQKKKKNDDDDNDADDDPTLDTLLVEQFRPPVGRATLEFPAGLIDEGETPEQAALRELREETGYVGEACRTLPVVSPLVCMSPGLCDETVRCVVVVVDLDNPYNDPDGPLFSATPDDGEHITVHRVSLRDGFRKLLEEGGGGDNDNDGAGGGRRSQLRSLPMPIEGLYLFAMGLEIGKSL